MNLRLLGRDAAVYAIGNITSRAASLLIIPLYTHVLTIEDFGRLALLLLTAQVMIALMNCGARNAFLRFAAEYREQGRLGHLFATSILVIASGGAVVTLAALLVSPALLRHVLHSDGVLWLMALTCGIAFSQTLYEHALVYYRVSNESMRYVLINTAQPLLLILTSMWLLLFRQDGLEGALLAQMFTYGALWLFVCVDVISRNRIGLSAPLLRTVLRYGLPLVFVMSADLLMEVFVTYSLSHYGSLKDVAVFSLAVKIAQVAYFTLVMPFQLAYEPFVFSNLRAPALGATIARLLTYLTLAFAFVAFGIVLLFRDLMVLIAPQEYSAAYLLVFLLLPGMAFKAMQIIGQSQLHIRNRTDLTALCVCSVTIATVLVGFPLIRQWPLLGTVAVTVGTHAAVAMGLAVLGRRTFPIPLEANRLVAIAVLVAALLATVYLLRDASVYVYYTIATATALAAAFLLVTCRFFDAAEMQVLRGIYHGARMRLLRT